MNAIGRRLGVISLNWNNAPDTLGFLEHYLVAPPRAATMILVDNGSTDDSLDRIREWLAREHPKSWGEIGLWNGDIRGPSEIPEVLILPLRQNLGFTGGFNTGLHALDSLGGAEFVLSINNDTEFEPGALDRIVDALASAEGSVLACGPKILDPEGLDWQRPLRYRIGLLNWIACAFLFPIVRGTGRHNWISSRLWWTKDETAPVFMLPGSCILIRHEFLNAVGGFDPDFFFYWDEGALSERIRQAGGTSVFRPDIHVVHKWSRSVGSGGEEFLVKSTLRFFRKYRKYGAGRIALVKVVLGAILIARKLQGRMSASLFQRLGMLVRF